MTITNDARRRVSAIDGIIGTRLRQRRMELGVTQGGLGKQVGVTFQQMQKYEKGANRVSAARLYRIASLLDVPITYFFEPPMAKNKVRQVGASRRKP